MWRTLRISVLFILLATVIQQNYFDRADLRWKDNFYVAVYPVNADTSPEATEYIKTLTREDFEPMANYFADESARFNLGMRRPIEVQLGQEVTEVPPEPPANDNILSTIFWSLRFRWFAWQNSPTVSVKPDIRLFLLYYNPNENLVLKHSTALNKGRIGRVNLFADKKYAKQNLVVLAHELLHTLNATDKYDLKTGLPIYPEGFADADKSPLYPQDFAELMGGRVLINETRAEIPKSLANTLIGESTAREIGWLK